MTDLEMTKLCAEAMGYMLSGLSASNPAVRVYGLHPKDGTIDLAFDPLHDDAQAMLLVKKFRLSLTAEHQGGWIVNRNIDEVEFRNKWANRAIVEWVAKMQKEKK